MANLNKVMLIGNITRDLELKYLPSQTPVVEFGMATNRTWTAQDGTKKEEVTFVDCTCFGKQAETLAKYKKKGDPLFVEGRLKLDQWEAQDGSKRSKMRVVVENFQFLNRGTGMGQGAPAGDAGEEGGYAARQPRPAMRPAARPPAGPAASTPGGGHGANGDADAPPMEEDAPQIREDDIPF